nr:ribonuclease H-like domain-containing protein [Tanacetum cinerariifolium]
MDDNLFTYEVEIPGLPTIPYDKKEGDDSDDGDLDIYEPRVCYDENDKIYVEAVIFVYKRLVRIMYITVEQWLDSICGGHTKLDGSNDDKDILEEREPNDDHEIGNLDNDLVPDNASCHANNEEYEENWYKLHGNPHQLPSVCEIRRFEVIKYSFGPKEKYITIKEHEHDDWPRTKEDAGHAYQEIFRIMDEGWVLVIKPHNKTPYELLHGRTPSLSFMRPFGCPVIILNTLDPLGSGPTWIFDIDIPIKSMNYKPVVTGNQSNGSASKAIVKTVPDKDYILLPLWTQDPLFYSSSKDSPGDGFKPSREEEKKDAKDVGNEDNEVLSIKDPRVNQEKDANVNNTNNINTVSLTANAASIKDNVVDENIVYYKAILLGAKNRPPMLEKDMYDSWRSRMEMYMLNRQHGRIILESVEHGPLLWPSVTEEGVTRLKKYSELSAAEAIQADCDVKETNIILQVLPSEIYALVSTHKVATDLWERIQMLMQGISLTKQERECKLYDAFDKF